MNDPAGPVTPPQPGWYPDPLETGQERFWFGTQWSDRVRVPGAPADHRLGSPWSQPWTRPVRPPPSREPSLVRNACIAAVIMAAIIIVVGTLVPRANNLPVSATTTTIVHRASDLKLPLSVPESGEAGAAHSAGQGCLAKQLGLTTTARSGAILKCSLTVSHHDRWVAVSSAGRRPG